MLREHTWENTANIFTWI